MRIVLGAHGVQSRHHRDRGIARYVLDHVRALIAREGERIHAVELDRALPAPDPERSPPGPVRLAGPPRDGRDILYHVMSPFEAVELTRLWPRWAHAPRHALAVTLYDLIPLQFERQYLDGSPTRLGYRTRLMLLRRADAVLAISRATAEEAITRLALPRERVHVIGAACSDAFTPGPRDRDGLARDLARTFAGLRPGFVLYTGGIDFRKNIPVLLAGYGRLPAELRRRHPLVLTCRVLPDEASALRRAARTAGIASDFLLTGYVPDATLRDLYRSCALFVFPSLAEGFGLPVLEAVRCGAPAIVSDLPALAEVVPDAARRFDPTRPDAIAAALRQALSDPARDGAPAQAASRFSWREVAERTAAAYRAAWDASAFRRRQPAARRLPRVAVFTPLPPCASGIADYSARLLAELAHRARLDVFVDGAPDAAVAPPHRLVTVLSAAEFDWRESRRPYDRVLFCMGNSEFHAYQLQPFLRHGGDLLAHEIRFSGLYACVLVARGTGLFRAKLAEMYGDVLPPDVVARSVDGLSWDDAVRHDVYMAKEILARADRVFVHSGYAALLAAREGRPDAQVVPFALPAREAAPDPEEPPRLVSFGMIGRPKRPLLVLEAFARIRARWPSAQLAFVGRLLPEADGPLQREIERKGLSGAVEVTGWVAKEEYERRLRSATLALQLRGESNGEMSAALADCLSVGLPAVVTDAPASTELPRDAVIPLPPEATADELAATLARWLSDPDARRGLRARAHAFAASRRFAQAAAALWERIAEPAA